MMQRFQILSMPSSGGKSIVERYDPSIAAAAVTAVIPLWVNAQF